MRGLVYYKTVAQVVRAVIGRQILNRYDRYIIVKKVQNKIPYLKEVSESY